jgi:hypothetical protein
MAVNSSRLAIRDELRRVDDRVSCRRWLTTAQVLASSHLVLAAADISSLVIMGTIL